jgi:ribosome biogenesis GTPase A
MVAQVGPQAGGQVKQIADRLGEPLRIAIAGRLKAGKSTLVNALIGRRVAPTAAGSTWCAATAPAPACRWTTTA